MQTYTGTIAQLVDRGITLNGVRLKQPDLSMLTRIGRGVFAKQVGTVPKPEGQRGKPATIWEIAPSAAMSFTMEAKGAVPAVASNTVESDENEDDEGDSYDTAPSRPHLCFAPATI